MSNENKKGNHSNPNNTPKPKVKNQWIGESQSDQNKIRKGSEIPPQTPKDKKGK